MMGTTTVALGLHATFLAVGLPELRTEPEITAEGAPLRADLRWAHRGAAAAGGQASSVHPKCAHRSSGRRWRSPIRPDGSSDFELVGASSFPRHWVYDREGKLAAKAGLADFKHWTRHEFGRRTPWGDEDGPAFVTDVETALEHELAGRIIRGAKPEVRTVRAESLLTEQGTAGDEVFLLLDGVLAVDVDGEPLAEIGPGAILGDGACSRAPSARRPCRPR